MTTETKRFELPTSRLLRSAQTKTRNGKGPRKKGNSAGRPTAEELDRRKKLVMEVATALFIERGYTETSIVEIAALAGVATRTLYHHFGDKEAIFREVVYARDLGIAIERPHVEEGDTLFSALRRTSDYALAVTCHPPSIGLMRLMIAESNRFPEFMRQIGTSVLARFHRQIERVFIELEAAKLVPPGNHARSAELFADSNQGSHPIMIYTNWDPQPPTPEDLDERVEFFILGRFGSAIAKTAKTKKAKLPRTPD